MELHTLPVVAGGEMMRRGEIQDGKTLTALMFVQCFRRRYP